MSPRSRLLLLACLGAGCIILGGCKAPEPATPAPLPGPLYAEPVFKPPPPYISVSGVGSSEAGGPVLLISVTVRGDYKFVDKNPDGFPSTVFIQLHMEKDATDGEGDTKELVHELNAADLVWLNDTSIETHQIDLTATVGDLSKVIYAEYHCKFWVESPTEPDGWVSCSYEK